MVDKLKQSIIENTGLLLWRSAIVLIMVMCGWNINMFVGKIDALELNTVKKPELYEIQQDVKIILHTELPKISMFIGCVQEYMRSQEYMREHEGRKVK